MRMGRLAWVMYANGAGIPQDYDEGEQYRKAAEQGYARGQNLGFMYEYGRGVPQDYGEAANGTPVRGARICAWTV